MIALLRYSPYPAGVVLYPYSYHARFPAGCLEKSLDQGAGSVRQTLAAQPCDKALARKLLPAHGKSQRQALHIIISDHHQPYIKAVDDIVSLAFHIHSGLNQASGETTKPN